MAEPLIETPPDCAAVEAAIDAAFAERCALPGWLAGRLRAIEAGEPACFDDALRARGALPAEVPAGERRDRAAKSDTDAEDAWPNKLESSNFVVKWGPNGGVTEEEAQDLLDAFEAAWDAEVEQWGYVPPRGSEAWLVDVFIGDTGGGVPSAEGAAGWTWIDSDDRPYVVIARDVLRWGDSYVDATAAHEFFHVLQFSYGDGWVYFGNRGMWWWETTASWAETYAVPDGWEHNTFAFGYGLFPYLPLDFHSYVDEADSEYAAYRQYGTFLFPRYLTESLGDIELVRRSWEEPHASGETVETLRELLPEYGLDFDTSLSDFTAHVAVWDLDGGEALEEQVTDYGRWLDLDMFVARHDAPMTDFADVDGDLAPQILGTNFVEVALEGAAPDLRVEFAGDTDGNNDETVRWDVRLVLETDGVFTYVAPVPVEDDGTLGIDVPGGAAADRAVLAISVLDGLKHNGNSAGYRYRVSETTVDDAEPEDTGAPAVAGDEPRGGCGCDVGAGGAGWIALVFAGLVARRRAAA